MKASYKLGDELKKGPKKARPATKKPAAKPKAAEKKAAVKPKASKPKKAAAEKKATGQHCRSVQVMLWLQATQSGALRALSRQHVLLCLYTTLCAWYVGLSALLAHVQAQHLTGCLRCQEGNQVSCQEDDQGKGQQACCSQQAKEEQPQEEGKPVKEAGCQVYKSCTHEEGSNHQG